MKLQPIIANMLIWTMIWLLTLLGRSSIQYVVFILWVSSTWNRIWFWCDKWATHFCGYIDSFHMVKILVKESHCGNEYDYDHSCETSSLHHIWWCQIITHCVGGTNFCKKSWLPCNIQQSRRHIQLTQNKCRRWSIIIFQSLRHATTSCFVCILSFGIDSCELNVVDRLFDRLGLLMPKWQNGG